MTLYDLNRDAAYPGPAPDYVRVLDSQIGKGVYAVRRYPVSAVIGEIRGELVADPTHGTEYTFEASAGLQLEPFPPFRFLNHSCDPNCEFDWIDQTDLVDDDNQMTDPEHRSGLYLTTLRMVEPNEQLTIDYNWPASNAIPCQCNQLDCRGWVVAVDELEAAIKLNEALYPE